MPDPYVIIGTPARDAVLLTFASDLVAAVQSAPCQVRFAAAAGVLLPNLRTELVRLAIAQQASHLLFVDADMRFPTDTVARLLTAEHGLRWRSHLGLQAPTAVGANYRARTMDAWTARTAEGPLSSRGKSGVEEVETVGFGVTLVNLGELAKMPEPWFGLPWDGQKHVGEDVYFCARVREQGGRIYVDHDLSQHVRHTAARELGVDDA